MLHRLAPPRYSGAAARPARPRPSAGRLPAAATEDSLIRRRSVPKRLIEAQRRAAELTRAQQCCWRATPKVANVKSRPGLGRGSSRPNPFHRKHTVRWWAGQPVARPVAQMAGERVGALDARVAAAVRTLRLGVVDPGRGWPAAAASAALGGGGRARSLSPCLERAAAMTVGCHPLLRSKYQASSPLAKAAGATGACGAVPAPAPRPAGPTLPKTLERPPSRGVWTEAPPFGTDGRDGSGRGRAAGLVAVGIDDAGGVSRASGSGHHSTGTHGGQLSARASCPDSCCERECANFCTSAVSLVSGVNWRRQSRSTALA
eukprot:scaffold24646_cov129-Isochrysis_galbana.AAC.1